LEKILNDKGIKTVVVAGTAARALCPTPPAKLLSGDVE
jgi:hypothetical protein